MVDLDPTTTARIEELQKQVTASQQVGADTNLVGHQLGQVAIATYNGLETVHNNVLAASISNDERFTRFDERFDTVIKSHEAATQNHQATVETLSKNHQETVEALAENVGALTTSVDALPTAKEITQLKEQIREHAEQSKVAVDAATAAVQQISQERNLLKEQLEAERGTHKVQMETMQATFLKQMETMQATFLKQLETMQVSPQALPSNMQQSNRDSLNAIESQTEHLNRINGGLGGSSINSSAPSLGTSSSFLGSPTPSTATLGQTPLVHLSPPPTLGESTMLGKPGLTAPSVQQTPATPQVPKSSFTYEFTPKSFEGGYDAEKRTITVSNETMTSSHYTNVDTKRYSLEQIKATGVKFGAADPAEDPYGFHNDKVRPGENLFQIQAAWTPAFRADNLKALNGGIEPVGQDFGAGFLKKTLYGATGVPGKPEPVLTSSAFEPSTVTAKEFVAAIHEPKGLTLCQPSAKAREFAAKNSKVVEPTVKFKPGVDMNSVEPGLKTPAAQKQYDQVNEATRTRAAAIEAHARPRVVGLG